VTEAFSRLEANLRFARGHKVTVVLTSPMPGEGKTTVATNLALVASRHGRRVLLIDADMRRGDLSAAFQAARTPGLAEVLQGAVSFDLARRTVDVGGPGAFHYLTSGSLHSNPLHLLETRHMRELLAAAAAEYDLVLIDTPPLNAVVDAVVLGAMSDGVLIVARAGHTTMDALLTGMEHLLEARAPIIGVVLNDVDLEQDASYDSEYRNFGRYAEYYDDLSESTSSPDRRAWRPRGTS
jgi:succinoglycan biosynthesis transport protein ExoP